MEILEIVLLAAGAIVFLISFCIPVKEEKLKEETRNLAVEEVKKLVTEELGTVRGRLSELSGEEVKEQIAKSERTMERISNEKIMAVNEYSDTVLEEIHKNHEEVVFLYDMLKNKKENLSESFDRTEQNLRDLLQQVKDSEITVKEKLAEISEKTSELEGMKTKFLAEGGSEPKKAAGTGRKRTASVKSETKKEKEILPEPAEVPADSEFRVFVPEKVEVVPKKRPSRRTQGKPDAEVTSPAEDRDVMLLLSDAMEDGEAGANSNRKILKMHEAGKSNMAIARELGLGVGEVRLVIDLYEGTR